MHHIIMQGQLATHQTNLHACGHLIATKSRKYTITAWEFQNLPFTTSLFLMCKDPSDSDFHY